MANQVEGIKILAQFVGNDIERQALSFQFFNDGLLALGGFPTPEEPVEASKMFLKSIFREVAQGFGDKIAVLVKVFHPFGDNVRIDAIDVDLAHGAARRRWQAQRIDNGLVLAGCRRNRVLAFG